MTTAVECKCPACEKSEAKRLADAVATFRVKRQWLWFSWESIREEFRGRTYGCLHCGLMRTVTLAGEVIVAKGVTARKPETETPAPGPKVTRNSDRDLIMSAEQMP